MTSTAGGRVQSHSGSDTGFGQMHTPASHVSPSAQRSKPGTFLQLSPGPAQLAQTHTGIASCKSLLDLLQLFVQGLHNLGTFVPCGFRLQCVPIVKTHF